MHTNLEKHGGGEIQLLQWLEKKFPHVCTQKKKFSKITTTNAHQLKLMLIKEEKANVLLTITLLT